MKAGKLPTRMALLLTGFTVLTLQSARNIHLYGVVAPFVLAGTVTASRNISPINRFENLFTKIGKHRKRIAWPGISILIGILLLAIPTFGSMQRFSPAFFPVHAVEWLKSHPQEGNMLNPFDWGGYISFMLWPETLVFIDSQGDIYGEAFIREYEQVITLDQGWQGILSKYQVNWALIPGKWALAKALVGEGWKIEYSDGTAIILQRGDQASWKPK
jgi:hypothetical protein